MMYAVNVYSAAYCLIGACVGAHTHTHSHIIIHTARTHTYIHTHTFSFPLLLTAVIVTGEGLKAIGFIQRHPTFLLNLLAFGLCSGIGQVSPCIATE